MTTTTVLRGVGVGLPWPMSLEAVIRHCGADCRNVAALLGVHVSCVWDWRYGRVIPENRSRVRRFRELFGWKYVEFPERSQEVLESIDLGITKMSEWYKVPNIRAFRAALKGLGHSYRAPPVTVGRETLVGMEQGRVQDELRREAEIDAEGARAFRRMWKEQQKARQGAA